MTVGKPASRFGKILRNHDNIALQIRARPQTGSRAIDRFMRALRIIVVYFVLIACTASSSEAQTVYITKTGSKYHRVSCQYLRKSKFAISIKEAVDRGYEPCSVCEPGRPSAANEKKATQGVDENTKTSPTKGTDNKTSGPTAAQCTATTKAGTRCKRMTTDPGGKCYQHK
jgi:hypothetical protein